jgi:hypothetical protein
VFAVDVLRCADCGARRQVIALITEADPIQPLQDGIAHAPRARRAAAAHRAGPTRARAGRVVLNGLPTPHEAVLPARVGAPLCPERQRSPDRAPHRPSRRRSEARREPPAARSSPDDSPLPARGLPRYLREAA